MRNKKRVIFLILLLCIIGGLFLFKSYRPRMSTEDLKQYAMKLIAKEPDVKNVRNVQLAHVSGNQYTGYADITAINNMFNTEYNVRIKFDLIYDRENIMLKVVGSDY